MSFPIGSHLRSRRMRPRGEASFLPGSVRSSQMRFGVWCRGVTPAASHKNGPAVVGGTVALDGTIIRDGDLVIADEDGVVIWPKEQIVDLLARAQARLQEDNTRLVQLQESLQTSARQQPS